MRRFIDANRSLLDKSTIDEAWAHTYVGRGAACAEKERNKVDAFRDYLRALRYKTTYLPAWGAIIKLFISKRTAESFKGILRWVIRASGLRRPANE